MKSRRSGERVGLSFAPIAALVVGAFAPACIEPFHTRSAYDDVPRWCGDPGAFDAEVAACRAVRAKGDRCGGVMSYAGQLEGRPVAVASRLDPTVFTYKYPSDGGVGRLSEVLANGKSPYFGFELKLKSVGGDPDVPTPAPRTLSVNPSAGSQPNEYYDDQVSPFLRLSVSRESVDLGSVAGSGALVIEAQRPDELKGHFAASFGKVEDHVDACFHLLAQEVKKEF